MLTALMLTVCSQLSPSSSTHGVHLIRVELLTQDQIENSPVDVLTRVQLHAEDRRLTDNMPTLILPSVLLGVGGGVLLVFGVFTGLLINAANHSTGFDTLGDVLLGILTGVIATAGGVVAIVGGVILPTRIVVRDNMVARQDAVHARLDDLDTGRAQEPLPVNPQQGPQAQRQLLALEDKKPGLGLPIGLMCGGAGAGLFGAFYWATYTSSSFGSSAAQYVVPITLFALGFLAEGFGVWQLISRVQQRTEVDAEIRDFQDLANDPNQVAPPPPPPDDGTVAPPAPPPPPPPGADRRLPPNPMQFSLAFRF